MPSSADAEVEAIINGPESFTPDTRMIMGESAEAYENIISTSRIIQKLLFDFRLMVIT